MILSIVLFDDWVFPAGQRSDDATIIEEIVALVLYGVTQRPDEPEPENGLQSRRVPRNVI